MLREQSLFFFPKNITAKTTWANAHDGKACAWVEKDLVIGGTLGSVRYGLILGCTLFLSTHFIVHRRSSGKGSRLIIFGTGGENGWVPNTTLIFCSKKHR